MKFDEQTKKNLYHLRDRRNRLEHFEINESVLALKSSSLKVLNSILDFINEELGSDELVANEDILRDIRINLRDFIEFIDKRMKTLGELISTKRKETAITFCPSCYQEALCTGEEIKCLFCGYKSDDSEDLAHEFVWEILRENEYECVTRGGEYPLYDCIECNNHTLVHLAPYYEDKGWICFSCGYEWESKEIVFCSSCGERMRSLNGSFICRNCIDYIWNKDD